MEHLLELYEVVVDWTFLPLALAILLVTTVGTGAWKTSWTRVAWLFGLGLLGVSFYLGIARHEWGEVLFNGQLL